MLKGGERRHPDHALERFFVDRWSPRTMSGEELQARETPSERRALAQSVCEGPFSL